MEEATRLTCCPAVGPLDSGTKGMYGGSCGGREEIVMRKFLVLGAFVLAIAAPAGSVDATSPSDVSFVVETSFIGPGPFVASGPAVDEGVVCPSGLVFDIAGQVAGASPIGFNFQGIKLFECADGSGEFAVGLRARIDLRGDAFNWNVLWGTGDYAKLHGAGLGEGIGGVPCGDPNLCILDVYTGGVHID